MPIIKLTILIATAFLLCDGPVASAQSASDSGRDARRMPKSREAPDAGHQRMRTESPSSNAPFENQLKKFSAPLSANGAK